MWTDLKSHLVYVPGRQNLSLLGCSNFCFSESFVGEFDFGGVFFSFVEEMPWVRFFLLWEDKELDDRSWTGVLLCELPGGFLVCFLLSLDSFEGEGVRVRFEGFVERMWEISGRGGGGRKSSLNSPLPLLVCATEGVTRLAINPSSLLVMVLSGCFFMSPKDLVSGRESAKLWGGHRVVPYCWSTELGRGCSSWVLLLWRRSSSALWSCTSVLQVAMSAPDCSCPSWPGCGGEGSLLELLCSPSEIVVPGLLAVAEVEALLSGTGTWSSS